MVLSIPIQHPSTPPSLFPPNCSSASEISWNAKGLINFKCHPNIRKHRPRAYILGFIKLPYFGSEQFRKIYLVERICICIWIDVFVFVFVFESMLNKIFVFVFVFEKSKFLYLYLYLYLIKRIWPQPCSVKCLTPLDVRFLWAQCVKGNYSWMEAFTIGEQ